MESYNMPPRRDDSAELTDSQAFEHAYQVLLVTEKYTSATPIDIEIGNLESFAHDREYGIKLVQAESLKRLLMISRTSVESQTRQGAARVIGSALWNNPEALEIVRGSNLVKRLIDIVKEENDASVCASLVFALSAAVAGEDGIREFLNAGGSPVLQELFAKGEVEVQGKCATFVEDNLPANRALIGDDELTQWCELFQLALLQNPQDITGEKVLSSLMYVLIVYAKMQRNQTRGT
jgi:nucleotide exchange factor SIL1